MIWPRPGTARIAANLAAAELVGVLGQEGRSATSEEQVILARWSGWGAVPGVFDPERADLSQARDRLHDLLGEGGFAQARSSTLNAHYTDAAIAQAMWQVAAELGFTGGRVLEPGCGSGTFIGLAPAGAEIVGVEKDPTTAAIASALYPDARIRAESFADSPFADGTFDLAIGNVPFGRLALHDVRHNRARHSIHNHFLIKSLHLTRPGGLVVAVTSRYTLDARDPAARRELAGLADLVGAIRLPTDGSRVAAVSASRRHDVTTSRCQRHEALELARHAAVNPVDRLPAIPRARYRATRRYYSTAR